MSVLFGFGKKLSPVVLLRKDNQMKVFMSGKVVAATCAVVATSVGVGVWKVLRNRKFRERATSSSANEQPKTSEDKPFEVKRLTEEDDA